MRISCEADKGTLKVSVAGVDGRGCKRDEHAEHLYNVQHLSIICKAQSNDRHSGRHDDERRTEEFEAVWPEKWEQASAPFAS
jgi:hypothetical protein